MAGPLDSWMNEIADPMFLQEHFDRAPMAKPGAARSAIPFLTWDTVGRLLDLSAAPDVMIAKAGSLVSDRRPQNLEQARALFESGCSIVIRQAEQHDRALGLVASAFTEVMRRPVNVHVFGTPASMHGFGWHYDCEDVFLAQVSGVKEYFLRENTVNAHPTIRNMPRDMQYERETSPVVATTLLPGDWLYIPHGWWHVARSVEDSLAISVGVLSECGARAADAPPVGAGC